MLFLSNYDLWNFNSPAFTTIKRQRENSTRYFMDWLDVSREHPDWIGLDWFCKNGLTSNSVTEYTSDMAAVTIVDRMALLSSRV